jgi:AsmA-like C-terminal region
MMTWWRRARAVLKIQRKLAQRRLRRTSSAAAFAGLLAIVGMILLSPLLLDDFVFLRSNLFRPSEDTLTIFQPFVLSENPRVTISQGTLSMPPNLSGKARTGEALAALVQGGSARLALENPVFTVELASGRSGALESSAIDGVVQSVTFSQSPLMGALEGGAFETLSIRNGTINVRTLTGHNEILSDVSADVTVKRKSSIRSKGTFTLRGEEFGFDTTLGTRIERRDAARMPIKAHIHSRLVNATLEGRLDFNGPLELVAQTAEIKLLNVRSVGRWLGQVWPSGPGLRDVLVRGRVDWRGDIITLQKGAISVDGNSATGTLALHLGAERPMVVGTLGFDTLSLAPYFPQPSGVEPSERGLFAIMKSQRDFAMPLLDLIDADLRVSTNGVRLNSWQAGRTAAGLTIKGGQAVLDIADMTLDGQSRLSALIQVGLSPTAPTYQTRGKIEGLELGPFTSAIVGMPTLSGRGDVTFNMRANGISGLDILSRASGRIAVELPQGGTAACTIKNLIDLAQSKAAPSGGACRSGTTLATLSGVVVVTDGVAIAEKVSAMTPTENLRVDGMIDLVSSLLDLTVASAPTAPSRTDLASQSRDVVSIRGRMEAPIFAIKAP